MTMRGPVFVMKASFLKIKDRISTDIHLVELLRGSGIAFGLRILGLAFGYIFTLIITRGYGAEAMGVFALSFTVLQIASVVGRLGMDTALLRFVAEYSAQGKWEVVRDVYKKAIKLVLPFSVLLSVSVFFLSPYIATYVFKKEYLTPYFQLASVGIVPFVMLFIHTESLRGLKKIKEYMFLQQVGVFFLSSMLLSVCVFYFKAVWIPIVIFVISVFVVFSLSLWRFLKYISFKKKVTKSLNKFSYFDLIKYSLPLLLINVLTFIMSWTDIIMIGIFLTEESVGIYSVALRISYVISFILFAVNSIAAPKIAKEYWEGNFELFKKLSQWTSKIGFLFGVPGFIILVLGSSFILEMFGKEFISGRRAFIILCTGQLVNTIVGSIGYILSMSGKQNIMSFIILCSFFLNIALNYLLIPLYGINGAAIATMVSTITWNVLGLLYMRYTFGFWNLGIGAENV